MVALPCGSRSISSTRFSACASAAARLTLVVVLPTPPFWFTTASTRAISGPRPAKHQVAGGIEQRNAQRHHFRVIAIGRHARQLFAGESALHRGEPPLPRNKVPAHADE